ncbi:MAG TPA: hypothetical protein VMW36_09530 [Patescibacteria group bacterium]|nr:hypothetical protein [Patescibacteria group bacterium]
MNESNWNRLCHAIRNLVSVAEGVVRRQLKVRQEIRVRASQASLVDERLSELLLESENADAYLLGALRGSLTLLDRFFTNEERLLENQNGESDPDEAA